MCCWNGTLHDGSAALVLARHAHQAVLHEVGGYEAVIRIEQAPHLEGVRTLGARAHVHLERLPPLLVDLFAELLPALADSEQHAGEVILRTGCAIREMVQGMRLRVAADDFGL